MGTLEEITAHRHEIKLIVNRMIDSLKMLDKVMARMDVTLKPLCTLSDHDGTAVPLSERDDDDSRG